MTQVPFKKEVAGVGFDLTKGARMCELVYR